MSLEKTQWRATGAYLTTLASKTGLLEETRLFLSAYAQLGSIHEACCALVDELLPQRSRATRSAIVQVLRKRLVLWHPSTWVLADLRRFAHDTQSDTFYSALLLHIARQDALIYDFIQQVIVPRWYSGAHKIVRSDVQAFLDRAQVDHPEVIGWSHATREKIAGNLLTVLRDYKILKGSESKHIVAPVVYVSVSDHLIHLLEEEGVATEDIPQHPDWHLWLWNTEQTQRALKAYRMQEPVI